MRIHIISIGNKMPQWINEGFKTYSTRLSQEVRLELTEIPVAKRHKNQNTQQSIASEAKALSPHLRQTEYTVCLDSRGRQLSTEDFADTLTQWQQHYPNVKIIIGGPDGLSDDIVKQADLLLSLSKMTLPHPLVRIIIAEQIYRAWSFSKGHPYHK